MKRRIFDRHLYGNNHVDRNDHRSYNIEESIIIFILRTFIRQNNLTF